MADKTWTGSTGSGSWFDAGNWDPPGVPEPGDAVTIAGAAVAIPAPETGRNDVTVDSVTLEGSNSSSTVSLTTEATNLGSSTSPTTLTVTDGNDDVPLDATFSASNTQFRGTLDVEARGGRLTIASQSLAFVSGSTIAVNNESVLYLTGSAVANNGTLTINSDTEVVIGNADSEPFTFSGNGPIVANGGVLKITAGSNVESPTINLSAGNNLLEISAQATFDGFLFVSQPDANIELLNFVETSWTFESIAPSLGEGKLTFFNQNGNSYEVKVRNFNQALNQANFNVTTSAGNTFINFEPVSGTQLFQPLPKPVVAVARSTVSLADILQNSFGTAAPFPVSSITLLPAPVADKTNDNDAIGYWKPGNEAVQPEWIVNGSPVTQPYQVQAGDDVQLMVGNSIQPISMQVQLTPDGSASPVFTQYNVYMVDPSVEAKGAPTAASVVASAANYATNFTGLISNNFCYRIANAVAAGAGAT